MNSFILKKWHMILLVFAWLPLAGPLWPFPTMEYAAKGYEAVQSVIDEVNAGNNQMEIDGKSEVTKEIQKQIETVPTVQELYITWLVKWVLKLISLVFGILSVIYAIGEFKGWRVVLILASILYLLFSYSLKVEKIFEYDYWWFSWHVLTQWGVKGLAIFYRETLFPIFHVLLITLLAINIIKSSQKRGAG